MPEMKFDPTFNWSHVISLIGTIVAGVVTVVVTNSVVSERVRVAEEKISENRAKINLIDDKVQGLIEYKGESKVRQEIMASQLNEISQDIKVLMKGRKD